ncbi:MAG: hypothetical protein RL757_3184 [Bacteroidota bacterium]|jgi:CHAT domain-containing protein
MKITTTHFMKAVYALSLLLFFAILNYGYAPPSTKQILADFDKNYTLLMASESVAEAAQKAYAIREILEKSNQNNDTSIANRWHQLGNFCHDVTQNMQFAQFCHQQAFAIRQQILPPNHVDFARSYFMLGTIARELGNTVKAIEWYKKSLAVRQAQQPVEAEKIANIYSELALACILMGDGAKAVDLMATVKTYLKDSQKIDELAEAYKRTGMAFSKQKKYQQAIQQDSIAIAWYQKMPKNATDWSGLGDCYNNNGRYFEALNNPTKAIQNYQKAIQNYQKAVPQGPLVALRISNSEINLAHIATQNRDFSSARAIYTKAIERLLKNGFEKNIYLSEGYLGVANTFFQQNQLDEALFYQQKSLQTVTSNDGTPLAPIAVVEALTQKAKILEKRAKNAQILPPFGGAGGGPSREKDKNELKNIYSQLDSLIYQLNDTYFEDESKINLIENSISVYEKAIALALEKHDTTAFLYYQSRSKAIILRQTLRDQASKITANFPTEILEKEQTLSLEIAYWRKQMTLGISDSLRNIAQDSLHHAKENLDVFVENVLKKNEKYAEYVSLKYAKMPPPSISGIRAALKPHMAFIEFTLGADSLYTTVISAQQVQLLSSPLPPHLLDSFYIFRYSYTTDSAKDDAKRQSDFLRLSHRFYQILLENPLKNLEKTDTIHRLRIVPDGFLGYIPFAALLEKQTDSWKPTDTQRRPFLIHRYALSFDYSSDLLIAPKSKNQPNNRKKMGAYGIGYDLFTRSHSHKNGMLDSLIFAKSEATQIAKQLGGDLFTDDQPTQTTKMLFEKNMADYNILFLSMHAAIDEQNPLNSGLIFTKKDSLDDNFLTTGEIYARKLNQNQLTVLSACNTANGTLHRGEGIMSFSRAWRQAGCQSLVATLWSVNEKSATLMTTFFESLQNGADKDLALQTAQTAYLNGNAYPTPNQWAFSVLSGDIDAIYNTSPASNLYRYAVFALCFAGALFLFFRWRLGQCL